MLILRIGLVVSARPVVGYANNFDFIRQSSCVGLWLSGGTGSKFQARPQGPVATLIFDGDRRPDFCVASVDTIFPYLATRFRQTGEPVDLRAIGLLKTLFAAVAVGLLLWQRRSPATRAFTAAFLLLAIGDFATMCYANALYPEFSLLVAAAIAMAATCILAANPAPPCWRDLLLLAAAIAWLGLAKQQYGGLAALLAAIGAAVLAVRWRSPVQAASLVVVGIAAPLTFATLNNPRHGMMAAMDAANRTDTFLQAVLPAARDQSAALRTLGLPPSCRAAIGQNWYTQGLQANHPCPAVLHLSRWRLLPLFLSQPTTFAIPMAHAISLSQPSGTPDMQPFERPEDAASPLFRLLLATSPTTLYAYLPAFLYRLAVAAAIVGGAPALALALWRGRRNDSAIAWNFGAGAWMIGIGGITALYALGASVFGDGYQDFRRHAAVLPVALNLVAMGLCFPRREGE